MTTVERKEYNETQILRTRSPVRSSQQNLSEFDSNLDYLLEDLQSTVSRPGSSLGQRSNFKETSRSYNTMDSGRSSSLNRVTNVKASNPVTEYASDDAYQYTSPDGRQKVQGYKKEKYMYKSNTLERDGVEPERSRMQNSINQLDSLLDDLQQVKKSSYNERETYNSATGCEPSVNQTVKTTVNRELHYGDTPKSSTTGRSRTMERNEYQSKKEYSSEGTYGDIRPIRQGSTSPSSRTSTLSRQNKVANMHEYPIRVVETPVPDIEPEVLAALDPKLHPPGNTKVTTTIKTYTYEIPGSGSYPTDLKMDKTVDVSEKYISTNDSITTPSKSFVYEEYGKKENKSIYRPEQPPGWKDVKIKKNYKETTTDNVEFYPAYQKPVGPNQTDYTTLKETVTTRNYQPGYQPHLDPPGPNQTYIYNETTTTRNVNQDGDYHQRRALPSSETYILNKENNTNVINQPDRGYPGSNKTYIYEEHNNTRNVNHYPNQYPRRPQTPSEETYIINKEEHNTTRNVNPYPRRPQTPSEETYIIKEHNTNVINKRPMNERGYPVYNPPPSKTTYLYKESNTTNYQNGGPPRERSPPRDVETFNPKQPPYRKPDPPINIQYSYKSTNTTENRYKGGYPPDGEGEGLLPRKFPTDDGPDGPPKRIDDLMATIGREPPNSPLNAGFNAHEREVAQQRKIDCFKEQNAEINELNRKEPAPVSKNVTGPPVYYPPGHEMFAKKEEGGGGWRAEGAYAKASGKGMYEAESSSKSKSKKGMAVVPVCLPLCCGLPCTIL